MIENLFCHTIRENALNKPLLKAKAGDIAVVLNVPRAEVLKTSAFKSCFKPESGELTGNGVKKFAAILEDCELPFDATIRYFHNIVIRNRGLNTVA